MSKETKFLNRLNELFSGTDLLDPEPCGGNLSQGNRAYTSPFTGKSDMLPAETPPENDKERQNPQSKDQMDGSGEGPGSEEPESDWPDSTTEPETQIGWEEYLDAIERDERVGFRFDANADEIMISKAARDKGSHGENGNVLALPLSFGDNNLGTIELESDSGRSWSEADSQLVADIVRHMGLHLENLRLLSQADQYRHEAEVAVRRLTRSGWENYLDAQNKPVVGYVYDRNRVTPLDANHLLDTEQVKHISVNRGTNQPILQPLNVRDETIGELILETGNGPVGAELVEAVAERLGTHIESLRLLEETEQARQQLDRRAAELETVAKVSTAAATILDPHTLLQSVVDLTKQSFELYHVHIYLLDEHTPFLNLIAGSGEVGRAMVADQHRIDLVRSQACVAKAARYRNGVIVQDVRNEPDYQSYPLLPDSLSELSVPMIAGEQVLGVFGVMSETADRFGEDEMRTFSTLAAQVAVAMRNAELYAEQTATVERLRELDHLKSAFLANMSHELRTPLNSILGFAQVILEGIDGPLTEEMENDLQLIAKNGKHLLNLINDVLDMAKIEAGRMSLVLEPFNLRELLEDVLQTTEPLASNKSLYLQLESEPRGGWEIIADRFRMRQILLNLVGNAIKFTESGGVTIRVNRSNQNVVICIQDTGLGIPDEQLESIFEAFSQVDSSTTRKVGGTGLGLPISRRLVELHGGQLWAESSGVPGEGSTFWLKLPFKAGESTD